MTDQTNVNTTEEQVETPTEEVGNEGLIVLNDVENKRAHWYVVHTYSGHERKVAELVKARAEGQNLTTKILKILIPTQQKIVVSEGKKREVNERLFPGYILVNMAMGDESWYLVRSTKGVTGFVGTGTKPTPLPQKEVDTLMKYLTMEAPKFEAKFKVGDSVKISDGPFRDFLGKIDDVNDDQGKVRVLVSVFGRETPVELDFTQIISI